MTTSTPPRLCEEPDTPERLRLALRASPIELPSEEEVGALRQRLAELVGAPQRLSERSDPTLQQALLHDAELPTLQETQALKRALTGGLAPSTRVTPSKGHRLQRRPRVVPTTAIITAIVAAAGLAAAFYAASKYSNPDGRPQPTDPDAPSVPTRTSNRTPTEPPPAAESAIAVPGPTAPDPSPEKATPSGPLRGRPSPLPAQRGGPAVSTRLENTVATPMASSAPASNVVASTPDPEEVRLLREARNRLSADPKAALSALAQHKQRYPNSALAEEREVLTIQALRRSGRDTEAEQRQQRFLRDNPGSLHRRRLEGAAPPEP